MFKFKYDYTKECTPEDLEYIKSILPEAVFKRTLELKGTNEALWHEVLQEFVKFLGDCYGYDISDRVAISPNKWCDISKWTGPVFDPNESL
jgi:hypothetical protein